ncbi:hypothetical protein JQ543_27925 [Bradyrhizobium diazoefficiens]|nr:hypothetical protein [Bradyrhizobium diazoefficiens]MBR0851602.1 hypothetical protein [Bradyrhizobium diazoefficiens]
MTTVTLHNDDQGDLYVMAWDFNNTDAQGDPTLVQDRIRLNHDKRLDIQVQADGDDHVHIRWWAQLADNPDKTAEHESTEIWTNVTTFFG